MTSSQDRRTRDPLALGFFAAGCALLAGALLDISWAGVLVAVLRPSRPLVGALADYYLDGQRVMGIAALVCGAILFFSPGSFKRITDGLLGIRRREFLLLVTLVGLGGALATQWFLFENLPHVTDAISHDFQARILLKGRFYADLPPCPETFFQHHVVMTTDGKWFSKYTPGHPALLALGYVLHARWLPVPLLHALTAIVLFFLVGHFHADSTSRWVALLFALSPLSTLLGASFMSHSTFLFLTVLGMYGLALLMKLHAENSGKRPIWATATWTGLAWGWALITRPHDAVIAALMVLGAVGLSGRKNWLRLLSCGLRCIPGLLPPLLLLFLCNRAQYGSGFALGYGFTQDQSMFRIYQASFGLHDGFTWRDAATITLNTLYRFDRAMLGWPVTLPLCLLVLLRRINRLDLACMLAMLIHGFVYFFYDYYGLEFEARYYLNILPLALLLLVRALQGPFFASRPALQTACSAIAALLFAHSFFHFWPSYIVPTYSNEYEGVSSHPYRLANSIRQEKKPEAELLVLIESTPARRFLYSAGFLHNDPALEGPVIFARYLPELVPCLLHAFPGREPYVLEGEELRLVPLKTRIDAFPQGSGEPAKHGLPAASSVGDLGILE